MADLVPPVQLTVEAVAEPNRDAEARVSRHQRLAPTPLHRYEISRMDLLLGSPDADHLLLRPLRRSHPEATDFWDANWLKVDVEVRGGAFRGAFEADLRTDELARFAEELERLGGGAAGPAAAAATLESMEGWVKLRLLPTGRGPLEGSCEVRDDPALGAALRFRLVVEPGQLPALRAGLAALLHRFPVVGSPDEEGSDLLAAGDDPDEE